MRRFSVLIIALLLITSLQPSLIFAGANSESSATTSNDQISERELRRTQFAEQRKLSVRERQEKVNALKELTVEQLCAQVSSNLDARIDYYEVNHLENVQLYESLAQNISDTLIKLTALGLDVKELQAKLQTVNQMVIDLDDLHQETQTKLQEAKQLACGESNGEFASKINESQDLLQQMRTQVKKIRTYLNDEFSMKFKSLRESIK